MVRCWPLMGVGVGGVTGSDQAVLGRWNRSTEAVGVAIYPGDGLVWLGQTARCELHWLCFLRKPFVWAGYTVEDFSHRATVIFSLSRMSVFASIKNGVCMLNCYQYITLL